MLDGEQDGEDEEANGGEDLLDGDLDGKDEHDGEDEDALDGHDGEDALGEDEDDGEDADALDGQDGEDEDADDGEDVLGGENGEDDLDCDVQQSAAGKKSRWRAELLKAAQTVDGEDDLDADDWKIELPPQPWETAAAVDAATSHTLGLDAGAPLVAPVQGAKSVRAGLSVRPARPKRPANMEGFLETDKKRRRISNN